MWSLASRRTKRISGFRKFRLVPLKDFFDSIGQTRKSALATAMSAFPPDSDKTADIAGAMSGLMHRMQLPALFANQMG
jgi:hypothetical protein